jgi:hypothetical protein
MKDMLKNKSNCWSYRLFGMLVKHGVRWVVHDFLLKNSKGGLTTRTPSNQKVEEKMNIIISWDGCSQIIGKW